MKRDLETDIRNVLGNDIRNGNLANQVYAALCNVVWEHEDGSLYSCSWRSAGAFVDGIVNPDNPDYCNFYCSGNEGTVDRAVFAPLAALGWSHDGK